MFTNKKKAFTLIEMLIVIVIIGILAAALIPRLSSARSRANDTARKADLQQLATLMNTSIMDTKTLPAVNGAITGATIWAALTWVGMNGAIPHDPISTQANSGIAGWTPGQYTYVPVMKNGVTSGGFVLMAQVELLSNANWVVSGGAVGNISGGNDIAQLTPCTSVTIGTTPSIIAGGACVAADATQLRYIITQ